MMKSAETNNIVITDEKLSVYISQNTSAIFSELNQALECWDYAHGAHVKIVCDALDAFVSPYLKNVLLSPRVAHLSKSLVFFTVQLDQIPLPSLNNFFKINAIQFPAHIRFVCPLKTNSADIWIEALARALIDGRFSGGTVFEFSQESLSEKQVLGLRKILGFPSAPNNLVVSYKNSMGVCEVLSSDVLKSEQQENTGGIAAFLSGLDDLPGAPAAAAAEDSEEQGMLISLRLDTRDDSDDEWEEGSDDGPRTSPPPLPFQEDEGLLYGPPLRPFTPSGRVFQYFSFFTPEQKEIYSIAEETPEETPEEISDEIKARNTA